MIFLNVPEPAIYQPSHTGRNKTYKHPNPPSSSPIQSVDAPTSPLANSSIDELSSREAAGACSTSSSRFSIGFLLMDGLSSETRAWRGAVGGEPAGLESIRAGCGV